MPATLLAMQPAPPSSWAVFFKDAFEVDTLLPLRPLLVAPLPKALKGGGGGSEVADDDDCEAGG